MGHFIRQHEQLVLVIHHHSKMFFYEQCEPRSSRGWLRDHLAPSPDALIYNGDNQPKEEILFGLNVIVESWLDDADLVGQGLH